MVELGLPLHEYCEATRDGPAAIATLLALRDRHRPRLERALALWREAQSFFRENRDIYPYNFVKIFDAYIAALQELIVGAERLLDCTEQSTDIASYWRTVLPGRMRH